MPIENWAEWLAFEKFCLGEDGLGRGEEGLGIFDWCWGDFPATPVTVPWVAVSWSCNWVWGTPSMSQCQDAKTESWYPSKDTYHMSKETCKKRPDIHQKIPIICQKRPAGSCRPEVSLVASPPPLQQHPLPPQPLHKPPLPPLHWPPTWGVTASILAIDLEEAHTKMFLWLFPHLGGGHGADAHTETDTSTDTDT